LGRNGRRGEEDTKHDDAKDGVGCANRVHAARLYS
jgi:hypothetical protein